MVVKVNGKAVGPEGKRFARIFAMGEARVTALNNFLALGNSTIQAARMIQKDWAQFTDVAEKTLIQQINRYRQEYVEAITDSAKAITLNKEKLFGRLDVLSAMVDLCLLQRDRIASFLAKEKQVGMPMKAINDEIVTYSALLKDTQKIQFDLGVDQFHSQQLAARASSTTVTAPGGVSVRTETVEAVGIASRILDELGVPASIEGKFEVDNG